MKVLSIFDGISCGQVALQRAGVKVSSYMASEIDPKPIKVTQKNFPNTVQLGPVERVETFVKQGLISDVDLLIGGSPCQGFSRAGDGMKFLDPRSKLLFEFIEIKNILKPKYFLLENVKMNKTDVDIVSVLMGGLWPIVINSNKYSAQNRVRLYWTNIPYFERINDVKLWDILQYDHAALIPYKTNKTPSRERMWADGKGRNTFAKGQCSNITYKPKSGCLTIKQDRSPNAGLIAFEDFCRYLTPIECERLQTLPDDYTAPFTRFERWKMLGNCWTVDVVAQIFRGMT